jgi:hypothetical protein
MCVGDSPDVGRETGFVIAKRIVAGRSCRSDNLRKEKSGCEGCFVHVYVLTPVWPMPES